MTEEPLTQGNPASIDIYQDESPIEVDGEKFSISGSVLRLKEAQGNLNFETLHQDGLLSLTECETKLTYTKCKVDNDNAIFVGQQLNDKPNGFVRVIFEKGTLYEGVVINDSKNGFGRYIDSDSIKIGWWKNGHLDGKSKCYKWIKDKPVQVTEG